MTLEAHRLGLHFDLSAHSLQDLSLQSQSLTYHWGPVPITQRCFKGSEWHFPQELCGMVLGGAVTGFCSINHGIRRLLPFQITLSPFDHSKEKSSVYCGRYYPSITS